MFEKMDLCAIKGKFILLFKTNFDEAGHSLCSSPEEIYYGL